MRADESVAQRASGHVRRAERGEAPPCMRWRGLAWRSAAAAADRSAAALPQRLATGSEDPLEAPVSRPFRGPGVAPEVVLVFVVNAVLMPHARPAQGVAVRLFKILAPSTRLALLSPAQVTCPPTCPLVIHMPAHRHSGRWVLWCRYAPRRDHMSMSMTSDSPGAAGNNGRQGGLRVLDGGPPGASRDQGAGGRSARPGRRRAAAPRRGRAGADADRPWPGAAGLCPGREPALAAASAVQRHRRQP